MKNIFFLLLLIPLLSACGNDDDKGVICTAEFREMSIKVVDKDDKPFALDSLKVFHGKDNITLIRDFKSQEFKTSQTSGQYLIVDDSMKDIFINDIMLGDDNQHFIPPSNISVIGYKSNKTVISLYFLVTSDQCHVNMDRDRLETPFKILTE